MSDGEPVSHGMIAHRIRGVDEGGTGVSWDCEGAHDRLRCHRDNVMTRVYVERLGWKGEWYRRDPARSVDSDHRHLQTVANAGNRFPRERFLVRLSMRR